MSDYEFWLCLAIMIESAETMPDICGDSEGECDGLCCVVGEALMFGLIDPLQRVRLLNQIHAWMMNNVYHTDGYAFRPWQWQPRVTMCRELAAMCKGKS